MGETNRALQDVLAEASVPSVWSALVRWVEARRDAPEAQLAQDCRQLVTHLGQLDWQPVPPDKLSRSRSLTVEMHRQLMLLQTDLRFLSVTRQEQKRSQLLAQVGDRLDGVSQYCEMGQEYINGENLEFSESSEPVE